MTTGKLIILVLFLLLFTLLIIWVVKRANKDRKQAERAQKRRETEFIFNEIDKNFKKAFGEEIKK